MVPRTMGRREPIDLRGKRVAITGAARGIGLATARALVGRGARVAIGDLDAELARAAAEGLGQDAVGLGLDVTGTPSFEAFLDAAEGAIGPLDVLVNNAGIMWLGSFLEESEGTVARQLEINLHGVIRGTKLVVPRMLQRGGGHVVNIGSAASRLAIAGEATYVAAKHGVLAYSECAQDELLGTGIEISVVMPGVVHTRLAGGMDAGRGVRPLEPQEVADAVVSAIERPRLDVFVPAQIAFFSRLSLALPPRGRRLLRRLAATNRVATQPDWTARSDYQQRIAAPDADESRAAPDADESRAAKDADETRAAAPAERG